MQRHLSVVRQEPPATAPIAPAPLHEARPVDLLSMRLVLSQHLEELRLRGVPDAVLRPIDEELRRYGETVDQLVAQLSRQRPEQRPEHLHRPQP